MRVTLDGRPNILVFTTNQRRLDACGCYGEWRLAGGGPGAPRTRGRRKDL